MSQRIFSIGSKTVVTEAFQNTTKTETIRGVVPDNNGEISIKVTSGTRWSIFNAMVIESYPSEDALNLRKGSATGKPVAYNKSVQQMSEEEMVLGDIAIYPNHFKNDIQLIMPDSYQGKTKISLLDLSGKVLHTEKRMMLDKLNILDLRELHLAPGAYILQVQAKDAVKAFRVIKE